MTHQIQKCAGEQACYNGTRCEVIAAMNGADGGTYLEVKAYDGKTLTLKSHQVMLVSEPKANGLFSAGKYGALA